MKTTQEIIGLPIISIADGNEIGKVKNVLVNADKGAIEYCVIDNGIQMLSSKVIHIDSILGIGEHAVTIESENVISDIIRIPTAMDLLQRNINVKGSKLYTKKGRMIGEAGDFYVDEEKRCCIVGIEFLPSNPQYRDMIIPSMAIITYGKNIILEENIESQLINRISEVEKNPELANKNVAKTFDKTFDKSVDKTVPAFDRKVTSSFEQEFPSFKKTNYNESFVEPVPFKEVFEVRPVEFQLFEEHEEPVIESIADIAKEVSEESLVIEEQEVFMPVVNDVVQKPSKAEAKAKRSDEHAGVSKSTQTGEGKVSASALFEEKQRQYLRGKLLTKNICDIDGSVMFGYGTVIDDYVITVAKQKGKIVEITMNNKSI